MVTVAGRSCTICRDPQRADVESDILSGTSSMRAIARRWGFSPESIRRHLSNHLAPEAREAMRAVPGLRPVAIAERLRAVAQAATDLRVDVEEHGDVWMLTRALDSERAAWTTFADRSGVSSAEVLSDLADAGHVLDAIASAATADPSWGEHLAQAFERVDRADLALELRAALQPIESKGALTA